MRVTNDMRHGRRAVLAALLVVAVIGCDGSDTEPETAETSTPSTDTATDPTAAIDDEPATEALLRDEQLPTGRWAGEPASATLWTVSGDELTSALECVAIVGAPAEPRTGHGDGTWVANGRDVSLDHEVELFPNRNRVAAVAVAFSNSAMSTCLTAVLRAHADETGVQVGEIEVTDYDVGIEAAELGVDFVEGADVSMTVDDGDATTPVRLRVVTAGVGGGLTTLTVTAANDGARTESTDGMGGVDLAATTRAAVANLFEIFNVTPTTLEADSS